MWEHYLYTGDEKFLRETAYEFIRDAALFFADFMFEGPDGVLYSGPSASPENQYLAEHNGHKVPVYLSLSPTMDIQIISSALDIYTQVEDILRVSPETADEIRAVRARMPEMQIGKYGQLQEWIEDWEDAEPGHRHISHAYGL
jgi:alpha-L-fucosidase 2